MKVKNSKLGDKVKKKVPLADQIEKELLAQPSTKPNKNNPIGDDEFIGGCVSKNILSLSKSLSNEISLDDKEEFPPIGGGLYRRRKPKDDFPCYSKQNSKGEFVNKKDASDDDDEEEECDEKEVALPMNVDKFVDEFSSKLDIDPTDKDILHHFTRIKDDDKTVTRLADGFRDKITEIQTEVDAESQFGSLIRIKPEVKKMCAELGRVLSKYRCGRLPKMFKTLPTYGCWEELVYLTKPDKWSAAAMYQATRIFISSLKAAMAQRFLMLVLLPRIRDDIAFFKRLNYHLFEAMMKCLYKPAAFFKGIVFPLLDNGDCTLREAIIIGSVLAKHSVPIAHSSAAIQIIASMDYTGPSSIFLRILLDKKYALPYKVIDDVFAHFMSFENERRLLPVLWHQALITFIQRYKNDMSIDQKNEIRRLISKKSHYKITPEITRELQLSKCRSDPPPEEPMDTK